MTDSDAFVRARRPEQKEQRRAAILEAARKLATDEGVRNVTLGGVAEAVGLAKSNIARYFATREEIYLELTAEGWREWAKAVKRRLDRSDGSLDQIVRALTDTIIRRPLFCDLLGQTTMNLEHNASIEAIRQFKLETIGILQELTAAVVKANGTLTTDEAIDLVAGTTLLAGAIWPMTNPPPAIAALYATEPAIAAIGGIEFAPTLRRVLTQMAHGLPSSRGVGQHAR